MKRVTGIFLLVVSAILFYYFAVQGTFHSSSKPLSFDLPIQSLGSSWPGDALLFVEAAWSLLFGLMFALVPDHKPVLLPADSGSVAARLASRTARSPGGVASRTLFLNSLFLLSFFFVAYVGAAKSHDLRTVGAFATVGFLQIAVGLILLILSLFERPRSVAAIAAGSLLWLGGTVLGVFAFLQGG